MMTSVWLYAEPVAASDLLVADYVFTNQAQTMADSSDTVSPLSAPTIQLLAIYGVGSKRLIELDVNGQRQVFMPGQRWPLGESALQLIKILPSCVLLKYEHTSFKRCIVPKGAMQ